MLDALGDLRDLLDELVVGLVVAGFDVGSTGSLLETGLGHAQRSILGSYVYLQAL